MRGIIFTSLGKEYIYIVANGITKLNWVEIHTPKNKKIVKRASKYGAEYIVIDHALDAIPSKRNRRTLLRLSHGALDYGATMVIKCNKGNGSGIGAMQNNQWQNNLPISYYVPEISEFFKVVKISPNQLTVMKDI